LKVSQDQLQDLLELTAVDQLLARSRRSIDELKNTPILHELSVELRAASAGLLDASTAVEGLETELKRVEADLAVVDQRVKKDNDALKSTSVPSVAQGIQSELNTLAKRKSELEDSSLELMEGIAAAESAVAAAKSVRAEVETRIKAAQAALAAEGAKLASGIELSAADRKQLAERIPHELLELYVNKAKRGTPVGRLSHRECGACHMSITASALQELQNAPMDDLVTCPECSAILVR